MSYVIDNSNPKVWSEKNKTYQKNYNVMKFNDVIQCSGIFSYSSVKQIITSNIIM